MKILPYLCAAAVAAAFASPAVAATVTDEDFEGGASGWSDNTTEDPGANTGGFTRHLGRFGQYGTTSKTFDLSGTQTSVSVAFDFYRLDSWDGESFQFTLTDGLNSYVSSVPYQYFETANANIYNPSWGDSIHAISFDFATTASSITLSFSSTLDQPASDEAWGVDNLLITDNAVTGPGAIPEPATWAMMILGFGLVGGALRRRSAGIAARYA